MKQIISICRSFWPEGYIFIFFGVVFLVGVILFGNMVVNLSLSGRGEAAAGLIIGAGWAWFMDKVSDAFTDSGREWIAALKDRRGEMDD